MSLLGIDVGTTSLSFVLTDGAGRFLQARTYPGEPLTADRTQDPDAILRRVREAMKDFPIPDAVAVTGQMHGILYLDAAGQAVSPLYTWQSPLGDAERTPGETWAQYAARLTGYPASTGFGWVTHAVLAGLGQAPEAAQVCTIGDYVAMRLAGRARPLLHASNAASMGFFDLRKRRFDRDALRTLGVGEDLIPEVTETVRDLGGVFTAVGDNQASFAGAVSTADSPEGIVLANIGTGGQLSCLTAGFETCAHCETRPYDGEKYLLAASSLCGGRAYALLERFFEETLAVFGAERSREEVYAGMVRMLEALPADRPTVDPVFAGTREDPSLRGRISGLTTENLTPAALTAGFLEGIAAEFLPAYEAMCRTHVFRGIALSGNALRRNPYLQKAFLRLYGLPPIPAAPPEEAAYGAVRMLLDSQHNK